MRTKKTIAKYLARVLHSRESRVYADRISVLRDWIGVSKSGMDQDQLIQVLVFIYTEVYPNPKVVEELEKGYSDVHVRLVQNKRTFPSEGLR